QTPTPTFAFGDWLKARSGAINQVKEKANDKLAAISEKIKKVKEHADKGGAEEVNKATALAKEGDTDLATALKGIKSGVVPPPVQPAIDPSLPKPTPTNAYLKLKDRLHDQIELARKRGGAVAQRITTGLQSADALHDAGDDPGAIKRLNSLVTEIKEV